MRSNVTDLPRFGLQSLGLPSHLRLRTLVLESGRIRVDDGLSAVLDPTINTRSTRSAVRTPRARWGCAAATCIRTFEVLHRINETGVAIFFLEQNVQTALGLAERGYVLESGHLVLQGPSDEPLGSNEV